MRKRLLRLTAMFMLSCMVVGSMPAPMVFAEEEPAVQTDEPAADPAEGSTAADSNTVSPEMEAADDAAAADGSEADSQKSDEETAAEPAEEDAADGQDTGKKETEASDDAKAAEEAQPEAQSEEEETQPQDDGIIEKNGGEINYVFVESPYLETPGTERIAVSYGDGTEEVQSATLTIESNDGKREVLKPSAAAENIYLFEKEFSDESMSGVYDVVSLNVTEASGEKELTLDAQGMEAVFGVNEEYNGIEELQPLDPETAEAQSVPDNAGAAEATIVEVDPENAEESAAEIANALEEAEEEVDASGKTASAGNVESGTTVNGRTASRSVSLASLGMKIQTAAAAKAASGRSGDVVVALDPGHDSKHTGATGIGGLKEEVLTLKIAQYCKAELEKYSGVTVYMTRTTAACPYPNNSSSGGDIGDRVNAAVAAGADIFVSIHLNSSTASGPNGAEVIIPNKNWKPQVAEEGKELAQAILDELEAVGLNLRGTPIYSKDTTINEKYPDGSLSDYYSAQIYAKEAGIPGIIVEHAFLTNSNDVNNFLKTESGLKKLGVADAKGIAKYLGLSEGGWNRPALKSTSASSNGMKISWGAVEGASGYAVYRKTSGSDWKMIDTTTSTSYTDKASLTNGATYYYTVRAYKGSWNTAAANKYKSEYWTSFDSSGLKITYTTTPALSKSVLNYSGIKVSWNAVSGVSGYAVYRKASGGDWGMIGTTTSTSYTDTSASANRTYYYTVRAYRGNVDTAKANKYSAAYWSGYDSAGVSGNFLQKPALKSASASSGGTTVSWNAVSGASGYAVYRKVSGGGWGMIDTTTSTSYVDKDTVAAGKVYYYTVRAYRGNVNTAKANKYISAYWSHYDTAGVEVMKLATPALKATSTASSGIKVNWNGVSGASGYAVYRKTGSAGWGMIGTTTSTSYTDKNLKTGTVYYYTVRAYKGDVNTAKANKYSAKYWSGFDSKGVYGQVMNVPALKSIAASSGGLKMSWGAASGASGYAVYRKPSGGDWAMIDTTTSTTYTDKSNLTNGRTYYYTVRAYKGNVTTAKNNKYSAEYWSHYDTTGLKGQYLGIPALNSTTTADGGIKVNWRAVAGVSGYAVYRKTPDSDWGMIGTTTSTSYTDKSGMSNGRIYVYTVRSFKGSESTAKANKYSAEYWSGFDGNGAQGVYTDVPKLGSKTKVTNDGIQVTWNSVAGAYGYAVYRKPSGGDWGMIGTTTSTSYVDKNAGSSGTTYYYTVRAYRGNVDTAKANKYSSPYWSHYDTKGVSGSAYLIEGSAGTTVAQMVKFYEKYSPIAYPSAAMSKGGAATIEEFAKIFYEEATAENIKPEVVWCQALLETGYLKYGGDVKIEQFNFAGLGATGGGEAGNSFKDVRTGVRAQVQHMKAYANASITADGLKYDVVDTRFSYVKKGCAKYVEILGIPDNPTGSGWAATAGYGSRITSMIKQLKAL